MHIKNKLKKKKQIKKKKEKTTNTVCLEANFIGTGSKTSFQNIFYLLRLFSNCHPHPFLWSSVMGGGGKKFLPWFGGEPLWDPSPGVIPCRGLLLPSSARAEPRAAPLKERSLAETCCRSPCPKGSSTQGCWHQLSSTHLRDLGPLASPPCALTNTTLQFSQHIFV